MTTERNFNNLARVAGTNQQNIQHFLSHSIWEAQDVLQEIRGEISELPRFQNRSVLILDESAEEKASARTAGAGRQYNGRLGKVEMSQVGVFLACANDGLWTWVDGELFIPEAWFKREGSKDRKGLAIPPDRRFQTKIELGWQMIERVGQEGLPFGLVCGDTLYGRSGWLRRQVGGAGLEYCFDVPVDTLKPLEARALAALPETPWTRIEVRNTERG
ncbi:MAG TPA: transposase, partial [Blastocatellia bacterium]